MPSPGLKYLDYESFSQLLFSIVKEQLDYDSSDPLPDYRKEDSASLEKILTLVKDDQYYTSIVEKAAYLFVAIIQGHIYSNGNKRLGLITLLYFLITNGYEVQLPGDLYELCLFVADKQRNQDMSFDLLKTHVENYLKDRLVLIRTVHR